MRQLVIRPRAGRQTDRGLIHGRNNEIFLPFTGSRLDLSPALLLILLLLFPLVLWLHSPRRISASPLSFLHPSLFCTNCLHITNPIMSISTSSFHLNLSLPLLIFYVSWFDIFVVLLAYPSAIDVSSI